MKRFICLSMLFCCSLLGAQQELSLSQALTRALAADPSLAAAGHELDGLRSEAREARSRYLPRLTLKASYTRLDEPIDIQLDSLRSLIVSLETNGQLNDLNLQNLILKGQPLSSQEKSLYSTAIGAKLDAMIPAFDIEVLDRDLFRASLEMAMPIWMGGKIQALNRSARLKCDESASDHAQLREQLAAATIQVYLGNKLMEESLKLAQEAEAAIQEHRDRANSLFEAGLVARYQLQHAQVAYSDARMRSLRAQEGLALARAELQRLLGQEGEFDCKLTTPIRYKALTQDEDSLWAGIRDNNPSLKKLAIKRELVRVKKQADLGEYLPQIYAFAKYELLRDDLSLLDPKWAAGVSLSLNLFSGGEKIHRLQADRHLALAVQDKSLQLERLLRQALDKLYHGIRAEAVCIDGFAPRLEEAQESLRLAQSRFNSGMGISLEVVDAQLMVQKIKLERLQAVYSHTLYNLKINELAQSVDRFVQQLEEEE